MQSTWHQFQTLGAAAWDSRSVSLHAEAIDPDESDEAPMALTKKLTSSTFNDSDLVSEGSETEDSEADEAQDVDDVSAVMEERLREGQVELTGEACPSLGSARHLIGGCRPCGFFWKSAGCSHGRDCLYCHLCPEGELKARKKVKRTRAILHAYRQIDAWTQARNEPRKVTVLSGSYPETLPEPASAPGQLADTPSAATFTASTPLADFCEPYPLPGHALATGHAAAGAVSGLPSLGSALHSTGRCKPCIWFWKPQGCSNGGNCLHCHLCDSNEAKHRKLIARARRAEGAGQAQHKLGAFESGHQPLLAPPVAGPQPLKAPPSLGSFMHGTGRCKPCRWFWRPQGCENAHDCQHCHLCPMNEAKERKRLKRAVVRSRDLAMSSTLEEAIAHASSWLAPPPGL